MWTLASWVKPMPPVVKFNTNFLSMGRVADMSE
jgi:hypothetical protein